MQKLKTQDKITELLKQSQKTQKKSQTNNQNKSVEKQNEQQRLLGDSSLGNLSLLPQDSDQFQKNIQQSQFLNKDEKNIIQPHMSYDFNQNNTQQMNLQNSIFVNEPNDSQFNQLQQSLFQLQQSQPQMLLPQSGGNNMQDFSNIMSINQSNNGFYFPGNPEINQSMNDFQAKTDSIQQNKLTNSIIQQNNQQQENKNEEIQHKELNTASENGNQKTEDKINTFIQKIQQQQTLKDEKQQQQQQVSNSNQQQQQQQQQQTDPNNIQQSLQFLKQSQNNLLNYNLFHNLNISNQLLNTSALNNSIGN